MRKGLLHGAAWSAATAAATALSWWGVHSVLAGTVYDRSHAVPLAAEESIRRPVQSPSAPAGSPREGDRTTAGAGTPSASAGGGRSAPGGGDSTAGPASGPSSAAGPASRHTPGGSSPGAGPSHQAPAPTASSSATSSQIKGYETAGGRVVLELGEDSAQLVAATPASGWHVQEWQQPEWIRVTFTKGGASVSVFCTWHDHAPIVTIDGE